MRLKGIAGHSYCSACGWNAEALRKRVTKNIIPLTIWLPLWAAFAYYLVQAPVWFVALGVGLSLWGLGKTIYVLAAVPDMPRPVAAAQKISTSIVTPRFSDAGFTLLGVLDLFVGGFFILVGSSTLISSNCIQVLSTWSESDPAKLFGCLFSALFPLMGTGLLINHWRERKKEANLTAHGIVVMGIVISRESRGKGGPHIIYEFSSPTGEVLSGEFGDNGSGFQEGNDVLVLYDPTDPTIHRAVPSLRFYKLDRMPIF